MDWNFTDFSRRSSNQYYNIIISKLRSDSGVVSKYAELHKYFRPRQDKVFINRSVENNFPEMSLMLIGCIKFLTLNENKLSLTNIGNMSLFWPVSDALKITQEKHFN